jgi:hypothetical protein
MNEFERGFIVGLIDGEGSITLQNSLHMVKHLAKSGEQKVYQHLGISPKIQIANTSAELLKKAQIILGGIISTRKRPGRKPCGVLIISTQDRVYKILKEIHNDLIVKKRQAELVMSFCESRFNERRGRPTATSNVPYTAKEFDILLEIRKLNAAKGGYVSAQIVEKIESRIALLKEGYTCFGQKEHMVDKRCEFCGKQFRVRRCRGFQKYCSTHCRGLAWRAKQMGLSFKEAKEKWLMG